MERLKTGIARVTGIAIIVAAAAGLYVGGWWLARDTHDRGAAATRHSYERQESYRTELDGMFAEIADLEAQLSDTSIPDRKRAGIAAQHEATVATFCSLAARVVGDLPPHIDDFHDDTCEAK